MSSGASGFKFRSKLVNCPIHGLNYQPPCLWCDEVHGIEEREMSDTTTGEWEPRDPKVEILFGPIKVQPLAGEEMFGYVGRRARVVVWVKIDVHGTAMFKDGLSVVPRSQTSEEWSLRRREDWVYVRHQPVTGAFHVVKDLSECTHRYLRGQPTTMERYQLAVTDHPDYAE